MAKTSNRGAKNVLGRDLHRNDEPDRGRRHYPTLPLQADIPDMDDMEGTPTQRIRRYSLRTSGRRRSSIVPNNDRQVRGESPGRSPVLPNDDVQPLRPRTESRINLQEHTWVKQVHGKVTIVVCRRCGKLRSTKHDLKGCTGLKTVVVRREK